MKLYKYRSLANLWHVLDVVINNRLYCAHWKSLNDPLEGRYEIAVREGFESSEPIISRRVNQARDSFRIASLSSDPENFLLWSHYADGHKGIAIEIEIPEECPDLFKVIYSPFMSVFSTKLDTKEDMRHIFNGKTEEWEYEKEYRIIDQAEYFYFSTNVKKILLGPLTDPAHEKILRKVLPESVELVKTRVDIHYGSVRVEPEDINQMRIV